MKLVLWIGMAAFLLPLQVHAQPAPRIELPAEIAQRGVEFGATAVVEDPNLMRDYARMALRGTLPPLTSAEAQRVAEWMGQNLPPNEEGFVSIFGEEGRQFWADFQTAVPGFNGDRSDTTYTDQDVSVDTTTIHAGGLKR